MARINAEAVLRRIAKLRAQNTPAIRSLRRKISEELASTSGGEVLALALDLIDSGQSNARWVAYELVKNHPQATEGLTAAEVERLGNGIHDWAGVDCFACYVSGPAWSEGRLSDSRVKRWARSKDRWWRRAALVSTVPLNVRAQGGQGDARRTLEICGLLIDDRDDMVVKALSWALRALSVRDRDSVSHFVNKHAERLAPSVKREVRNKLTTGLKNPRYIVA